MKCPKCGKEMERGFIQGNEFPLKWSKNKNRWFVFSGESIGNTGLLETPHVEAWRCEKCRVGIFNY